MNEFLCHLGKHKIKITNQDRILFPKSKISKWDLIDYYQRIAPVMIPHIKNRPIMMHRFVNGIGDEGFYQKDAADYFPAWIKRLSVAKEDKSVIEHVLCNDAATLVYLTNQAVIAYHMWLSKADKLNYPDRLIFDFDPPSVKAFDKVVKAAKACKALLQELGLTPFVMTTGSKGLHVVTPIKRELLFDDVRLFARDVAQLLADQYPEYMTIEVRKNRRKGRVFIDYLRNAWAQTGVAPYSVRAIEKAPIATPLDWKEVNSSLTPQKYNIGNIFKRISRIGDPWDDIDQYARSVKKVDGKLELSKFN